MINKKIRKKLKDLFSSYSQIKLVYLFGSGAKGKRTILSDYDFAIYLDPKEKPLSSSELILRLIPEISLIVKNNQIDLVLLNQNLPPLFKYQIIKDGILIYQESPYKFLIESEILNQYFDFKVFQKSFNL
ncbi:MAG: type VII toxin-antitoxin system MntA family adenylyltransferase antitoxin [Minisyncoccia bacterium]